MPVNSSALVYVVAASLACLVGASPASAQTQTSLTPTARIDAAASATPAALAPEDSLPELITDRPDITESSAVVGHGMWQLETGMLFESDRADRVTTRDLSAPNALLRVGIGSRFELRLSGAGVLSESLSASGATSGSARTTGMSDFELGFKYVFLDQSRAGVDAAIIPIVSFPVGDERFSSGGADPTLKVTISRDLPRGFGLGGNLIVASSTEDDQRSTQTAMSVSVGHALVRGWAGFWELYGASALSDESGQEWTFDTGVTHPIGENAQFDVSVGRGLTNGASDWFVGVGFSIRGTYRHRR